MIQKIIKDPMLIMMLSPIKSIAKPCLTPVNAKSNRTCMNFKHEIILILFIKDVPDVLEVLVMLLYLLILREDSSGC